MVYDGSFESLMDQLRSGDDDAAATVFRRFTQRLLALARSHLESIISSPGDVEDVIQSVYKSFFVRVAGGQFQLDDWDELWGLLTIITVRKCANRRAYLKAKRRDVRREVRGESGSGHHGFDWNFIDREPSPLEVALLTDTVEALLRDLAISDREAVSLLLQGYTTLEIARIMTCSERTVRRIRSRVKSKLHQIYADDERPRP